VAATIARATLPQEFSSARLLFEEYAAGLGVDLCFQGFAEELGDLPAMYGAPSGALLLAFDGEPAGSVGIRRFSADTCEMKRLYVRQRWRGTGLGRRMALEALEAGKRLGYRRMVLDTLATMTEARALYRSLGFTQTAPYYPNPLQGVAYLERPL
jgi:ribosomal protein S18 acetylase RimI-like enzyme